MTAGASASGSAAVAPPTASLVRAVGDATPVVARLSVARSFWGRFRGLMLRASLGPDEGLYLPVNSIHMLFMRFPIDALFLDSPDQDGAQRVVAMRPDLPPWAGLVMPVRGAAGVVELPAGAIGRSGLALGDVLRLQTDPAR